MLTFSENTNTSDVTPPSGVAEVLKNLLMNIVSNPVDALVNANYIGILAWAIIFGIALKAASETTKTVIENIPMQLPQQSDGSSVLLHSVSWA